MLISWAAFQPDGDVTDPSSRLEGVARMPKPRYTPAISWRHSWDAARHPWRPA